MPFFNKFDTFDPLTGDVPEYPFTYLSEIAGRARSILFGKTLPQLVAAAKRIDREIERYFDDLKYVAVSDLKSELQANGCSLEPYFEWDGGTESNGRWRFKDEMVDDLEIPTASNCSEVDALKTIIYNRDSSFFLPKGAPEPEPDEYAEGKTSELFAVLALWLLADALEWTKEDNKYSMSIAAGFAVKAMDAVCYAEHLRDEDRLISMLGAGFTRSFESQKTELEAAATEASESAVARAVETMKREVAEHRSCVAQQLSEKRHAKRNQARMLVCGEWDKNRSAFPSAEKAGLHFSDWLAKNNFMFTPRTVTGWIREHAKQIGVRFR